MVIRVNSNTKTITLITIQSSSILIFSLIRTIFQKLFGFALYKMVDSEYSPDNYKSLKISIWATLINPKMLRFAHDHLKTKKTSKHAA